MDISRISGLASGLDTESIVTKLMQAHRMPLERMEQRLQLVQWQREDYRSMNSLLLELKNTVFDMRLESTYRNKSAVSSHPNQVSATANGDTPDTIYDIQVSQIAKGAFLTSGQITDGSGTPKSGDDILNTQGTSFDLKLNNNGDTVTVTQDMTINQFVNAVNAQSNQTNVTVSFDESQGRLFFSSTITGDEANIDFSGQSTVEATNFISSDLQMTATSAVGQDAQVKVNGTDLTYDTNQFSIGGVTFNLKGETRDANGNLQSASISIENDIDATTDKIKAFVDKYNEVVEKINAEIGEERYRDYPPLTDAQKEDMTESEIKLWEEKARSGMLRGDSLLQGILFDMRYDVYDQVNGVHSDYNQLAEIGISINQGNYQDNGKLYIDEDKLRSALASNPEAVTSLFTQNGSNRDSKGIADRLYDTLDTGIEIIGQKAGEYGDLIDNSYLGERIKQMKKQMADFEERLIGIENRYWNEFTQMEKAISSMNQQSAWLMQQIGEQ